MKYVVESIRILNYKSVESKRESRSQRPPNVKYSVNPSSPISTWIENSKLLRLRFRNVFQSIRRKSKRLNSKIREYNRGELKVSCATFPDKFK